MGMAEDTGGKGVTVELPDDDPTFTDEDGNDRCGVPRVSTEAAGEPCSHPVPNGICPTHGDVEARALAAKTGDPELPEGVGSGDPDHQMGDGRPPEGNKNGVIHGLNSVQSDPWGLMDHFAEEEPRTYAQIAAWFWDEAQNAPWPIYQDDTDPPLDAVDLDAGEVPQIEVSKLTRRASELLLVTVHWGVIWRETLQQAERGLAEVQKRKNDDGDYVDVVEELSINLPKNRMRREDRQVLKDLGLRENSPEAVAANAEQDMASAAERVAKRREQMPDEQGGGA